MHLTWRSKLILAALLFAGSLTFEKGVRAEFDCVTVDNCTYCWYGPGGANGHLAWCKPAP